MSRFPPLARALAALLLVLAIGCVFTADGAFFRAQTHVNLLGASSVKGMLAVGMTLVILAGGIDLSVGSVLAAAGMLFAALTRLCGWPALPAVIAALLAGLAFGLLNGLLAARLRLQPFIATLATMVVARGVAKWLPAWFGQEPSTKVMPPPGQPLDLPFYEALAGDLVAGVPVAGALFVALALLAAFVLHRTPFGRHVVAVGGNETAAHLAGIPVVRTKLATYAICGTLAGLGGVAQVARDRIGNPELGTMFELDAIAAVVIGGTALSGGRGGILLTLVGVLTIGYIEKILSINGVPSHWRLMIQGTIIVLAVLMQERR